MDSVFETGRDAFIGGTETFDRRKEGRNGGTRWTSWKNRETTSSCVVVLWRLSYWSTIMFGLFVSAVPAQKNWKFGKQSCTWSRWWGLIFSNCSVHDQYAWVYVGEVGAPCDSSFITVTSSVKSFLQLYQIDRNLHGFKDEEAAFYLWKIQ